MILWESLRPEDQERCLTELRSDRSWVIWCKAKPKDMPAQSFREYGKCIFVGKCKKQRQADESQAESTGGRHVTRARGWWKRGDVAACAAQTNLHCWVHQDALFNDDQAETHMREAWEHEGSKDELNIVLQGLEQHFWRGTEAGQMGCYEFPGHPVKLGREMDRQTKVLWEQGASAFNDQGGISSFAWEERRKGLVH